MPAKILNDLSGRKGQLLLLCLWQKTGDFPAALLLFILSTFPCLIQGEQDVESTELALAFQLCSGTAEDLICQPQKQPVFAYLPLRSFGFRFIIQGKNVAVVNDGLSVFLTGTVIDR